MTNQDSTSDISYLERQRVSEATGFDIQQQLANRSKMENRMVGAWDGSRRWEYPLCRVCGETIKDILVVKFELWENPFEVTQTVCDNCKQLVDDHYESTVKTKWDTKCPLIYRKIIQSWDKSIDHINVEASKKVTAWEYQNRGMYLYGSSGKGKTTAIWKLYQRIEDTHGFVPVVINSVPLARILAKQAKDLGSPDAWLCNCRVLIIDDFGKEKMTTSFAAMIYELINYRYEQFKPIILTSKFDSKNLLQRFSNSSNDSLGFDICRRISDVCEPINFDK